jgi:CrcB protein
MSAVVLWPLVALIGGVGALLRVGLADTIALRARHGELGLAVVNVSGAFALGLLYGAHVGHSALILAGSALLGSYTTFSGWQLAAHELAVAGQRRRAVVLIAATLLAGLLAAWAGVRLG